MPFPLESHVKYSDKTRAAEILRLMDEPGWACLVEEMRVRATERFWTLCAKSGNDDFERGKLRGTADGLLTITKDTFKDDIRKILRGEKRAS